MHSTHHTFLSTLASIILYLADTVTAMHMLYLYSLTDPDYNKNNGVKAHPQNLNLNCRCARAMGRYMFLRLYTYAQCADHALCTFMKTDTTV